MRLVTFASISAWASTRIPSGRTSPSCSASTLSTNVERSYPALGAGAPNESAAEEVDQVVTLRENIRHQRRQGDRRGGGLRRPEHAAAAALMDEPPEAEEERSRSESTDSVRLYLREVGAVRLLSRDREVAIAREIEAGELIVEIPSSGSRRTPCWAAVFEDPLAVRLGHDGPRILAPRALVGLRARWRVSCSALLAAFWGSPVGLL